LANCTADIKLIGNETKKTHKEAVPERGTKGIAPENYENRTKYQDLEPATRTMNDLLIALVVALPGIITAVSSFRNSGKLTGLKDEQRRVAGDLARQNGEILRHVRNSQPS
jgi:hypothetical protein